MTYNNDVELHNGWQDVQMLARELEIRNVFEDINEIIIDDEYSGKYF